MATNNWPKLYHALPAELPGLAVTLLVSAGALVVLTSAFRDALKSNLIMAKQRGVVLEIPELLLSYPVVSINQIALETGVTYPPARSAVYKLVEMGILREVTGRKNSKLFISKEVISILDS